MFGEACRAIEENSQKGQGEGRAVLVHCAMGISRSASVIVAYGKVSYSPLPSSFPFLSPKIRHILLVEMSLAVDVDH